jgi:hypothetical protein
MKIILVPNCQFRKKNSKESWNVVTLKHNLHNIVIDIVEARNFLRLEFAHFSAMGRTIYEVCS